MKRRLRAAVPYAVLPALVAIALAWRFGPETAVAIHAYVVGACRDFLAQRSAWSIAITIVGALTLTGLVAGLIALATDLRRLRLLSRTLARSGSRPLWSEGENLPPAELVDDERPFAFCHGLIGPRIYVSTGLAGMLAPTELRAVLLHEEVHARRRDPARVLAARALAAACFALPVARLVRDRYLVWLEVEADKETVRQVSLRPLTGALLKLLSPPGQSAPLAPVSHFNVTEERIRRLTDPLSGDERIPLAPYHSVLANGAFVLGVGLATSFGIGGISTLLATAPFCPIQVV